MKKLNLKIIIVIFTFSCNMSDQEFELPNDYVFVKEGGNRNVVLKKNKLVIDKGAVSFSYDEKFIFFSADTTNSMEPTKIAKEKLIYYIYNMKKDTFSSQVNYNFVKKFISKNKIKDENNILLK